MGWKTSQATQNGNSTVVYGITGNPLSTHDCVVLGIDSGNSHVRIEHIDRRINPTKYVVRVRVLDAGAVSFRLYGEKIF